VNWPTRPTPRKAKKPGPGTRKGKGTTPGKAAKKPPAGRKKQRPAASRSGDL